MKEEAEKKLQRYIRQLDHFERARRDEEAPLIEEAHRKQASCHLCKPCTIFNEACAEKPAIFCSKDLQIVVSGAAAFEEAQP